MVEGGGAGARTVERDQGRESARVGDFTDACQSLPAPCTRSLGDAWRKKQAHGDVILVRYADDAVLGFQHQADAVRFLEQFREGLQKFGLELHPDKTSLIEFGRYAAERRKRRGKGKPETFEFPGFTHIGGTNQPIGSRMATKLKEIRAELRKRMHDRVEGTLTWLQQVVRGYFQYHAIPGNREQMKAFHRDVQRIWYMALRRRSQRCRLTWTAFCESLGSRLPPVEVLQPYPDQRLTPNISKVGTVCVSSASTGLCGGQRVTAVPTATAGRHNARCLQLQPMPPCNQHPLNCTGLLLWLC